MKPKSLTLLAVLAVSLGCLNEPDPLSTAIADIEAGRAGTPLITQTTPGSEATVTFLVQSLENTTPRIVSDVTGWGESPDDSFFDTSIGTMAQVGSTNWFRLDARVAPGSRIEYLVVDGESDYRVDPNNPRRAWSRSGHEISEFVTPDYRPPREFSEPPTVPTGRMVEATLESRALGGERRLVVYLPPGYQNDGDYPVAVFHAGWGVAQEGQAPRILDWLIARGAIEPLVGLFLDSDFPRDPDNREGPPLRAFLGEEAPAWLAARFAVTDRADRWAVVAISYGAKDALDAALAPAQAFGRLGLLIPGRRLTPEDLDAFAEQRGRRLRVAILAGLYDQANLATARNINQSLSEAGHSVDFIEVPEGHNSTTWRNHLSDVLVSLLSARDPI